MIRGAFIFLTIFFIQYTCFGSTAAASDRLYGPIEASVIKVIDGDTLKVRARIWLHQTIDVSVRLRGIDTPELSSTCPLERQLAQKARKRLLTLLHLEKNSQPLSRSVSLRHISKGKYSGRIIAYVDNEDGTSVGDILLKEGIARPYRRKSARSNWCQTY